MVESLEEGRREERRWMRERALEMDSHQECMGSLLLMGAPPFWWWWLEVEGVWMVEDAEEEGESPEIWEFSW